MLTKYLSDQHIERLDAYLEGAKPSVPYLLIELMLRTGCRTDEVCRIKPCDFDLDRNVVLILKGSKHSEPRAAPLGRSVIDKVLGYCKQRNLAADKPIVSLIGSGNAKISTTKRVLRHHWAVIKIRGLCIIGRNNISLHSLRHTFAKRVYEITGKDIVSVQLSLGHKSLMSTQFYLKHISYDSLSDVMLRAGNRKLKKEK